MKESEKEAEDSLNNISELDSILNNLSEFYSKLKQDNISREEIFDSLYIVLKSENNWEHPLDFWSLKIEYEEALSLLSDFDFKILKNKIETPLEIIPKDLLMNYKVRIKSKGLIWVIHKYDADPFPSNPHAHLVDSGIKLDLSNGNCYKKKELLHTLKQKDLLFIRQEAKKKDFELPKMKI
jgi:hypothetical protein